MATSSRRLIVLSMLGLVLIGAAGSYLYRAANNPLRQLPTLDLTDTLPTVAETVRQAYDAVMQEPRSGEAWGKLGVVLLGHEFRAEAAQCFVQAERFAAEDYRWPYYLGMTVAVYDSETALACFQRAVEKSPQDTLVRLRLAEYLMDLGYLDRGEQHLLAVQKQTPGDPRLHLALAHLAFARKDYEQSRKWAMRSDLGAPRRRDTHELLARVYRHLGQPEKAAQHAAILNELPRTNVVWHDPLMAQAAAGRQDTTMMNVQVQQLMALGKNREAAQLLRRLVVLDPANSVWKRRLSAVLLADGHGDEATSVLEAALLDHPQAADLHLQLGLTHLRLERVAQAIASLQRAVSIKSDYVEAYVQLGWAHLRNQDFEAAREAVDAALLYQPGHPAGLLIEAHVLHHQGQSDQALAQVEQVLQINAHDVPALILHGDILLHMGRRVEARASLQQALQLQPDSPQARQLLAQASCNGS